MIVEFVGLPGSGKTTLHQRAVDRLEAFGEPYWTSGTLGESKGYVSSWSPRFFPRGIVNALRKVSAKSRRVLSMTEAMLKSHRLVGLAVWYLLMSRRSVHDKVFAARLFFVALGNYWRVRTHTLADQIVLFDEGVVHRAFTVFVDGRREIDLAAIRRYAHMIPLPDVLVYLKVSPDVALERTHARPRGLSRRFQGLSPGQECGVMADSAHMLDVLVDGIQDLVRSTVTIIVIDTNDLRRANAEFDAHAIPLLVVRNSLRSSRV